MSFESLRLDRITSIVYYKPENILTWKARNRKDHIIGINITGIADHDLGYKRLDLGPDYIYFFNQRDDFFADTKEVGYCYSIHFTTTTPIPTDSFCLKVSNTDEIVRMIQRIENARLRGTSGEFLLLSEFYQLCDTFRKLYDNSLFGLRPRMQEAKEYIDLCFKEKGCVDTAAEIYGVTRRRFTDLFRQHYGTPPGEYVLNKRMEYAQELLKMQNLSIADTAELTGFCDVYYFSRMFRKLVGMPPGEYRKQQREG